MLTRSSIQKITKWAILVGILIVVVGYAVFAFHDFILGPYLTISSPINGSTLTTDRVTIEGVVKRIQDVSLNDRSITISDKGNFKETMLLAPGYNIFKLSARDKFGRTIEHRLELIYKVN